MSNIINYLGDTFESLLSNLESINKSLLGDAYEDFSNDDAAKVLMEWISFSVGSLCWSSDRKLSDNIMELTRSLRIAGFIAKSGGMKLKGRTPQSVDVLVKSLVEQTIEQYSIVTTTKGNFIVVNAVSFSANDIKTINILEGNVIEYKGYLTDELYQSFDLNAAGIQDGQSIVFKSLVVSISPDSGSDSEVWSEVDFLDYNQNNNFTVDYINNIIEFGDGITGRKPPKGVIVIKFIVTKGDKVEQIKVGDVKSIKNPNTEDVYKNLTISNSVGITGTDGDYDIETIKRRFYSFKPSKYACITLEDFENHSLRFQSIYGNIAIARANVFREFKESASILQVKSDMFTLFDTFINNLKIKIQSIKSIVDVILSDIGSLRTLTRYYKNIGNQLKDTLNQVRTNYYSSLDLTQSAFNVVKNSYTLKADDGVDLNSVRVENNYQYSFTSEKQLMEDVLSKLEKYVSVFEDPKDINNNNIDFYINKFNSHQNTIAQINIDNIINDLYKSEFIELFSKMEEEVNNLLYDPATTSMITLSVMCKNGDIYVPANISLINELYFYFSKIKDPTVTLFITDGYGSIISNRIKISVKVNEIESGYSIVIVQQRIRDLLSVKYKAMTFGQGIKIYEVSKYIRDNINGVIAVSVKISDKSPELNDGLVIDDFGNLDMSQCPNRLIQGIDFEIK